MISVYQGSSLGLSESWSSLSAMLAHSTTSDYQADHVERYRISLPSNLSPTAPLVLRTFVSNSARPALLHGFGKVATKELLGTVINSLHRELHLCPAPEFFL
jgi:hypothetical protein